MSSENIELVRHTFELFNAGQAPLPGFWAEDAEVWPGLPASPRGPFKGRDELQRFFDGLLGGWKPGTAVVARGFEEAGDKVLVWFEWRAVGEASEVPTSSERMAVYTIRGAQIGPWNSSMTATPRSALRNQASPTGTTSRSHIKQ